MTKFFSFLMVISVSFLLWLGLVGMSSSPCHLDDVIDETQRVHKWQLLGSCGEEGRAQYPVLAEQILKALKDGYGVELRGVALSGDLNFDELPLESIDVDKVPAAFVRDIFHREGITEARIIEGPLIMEEVHVLGTMATNLMVNGYMIIKGPVSMKGTTFEKSVDFSRAVFYGPVDFSNAIIRYEGFFIKATFLKKANFEKTAFGTHSRFHKAIFGDQVTFTRAGFNGLAEFLEVVFQKEAGFSRTRFVMGTGFSGSQFKDMLDFSEATFDKDVYFRFVEFDRDAYFRRSTFNQEADFTQAKFAGISDFTKVMFEVPPQFTGTVIPPVQAPLSGLQNPQFQVVIFFLLVGFLLIFLVFWKKG
jgi:hypothetical protein